MTVLRRSVPSYSEKIAKSHALLFGTVKKAEKEIELSLAEKLHQLNELSRGSSSAYRLVGHTCHLYENDRFVRVLSSSAVSRRLKDALNRTCPVKINTEVEGHLGPEEVRRRRAIIREALLATLNQGAKLKEQLAMIRGHYKFSPFVIE